MRVDQICLFYETFRQNVLLPPGSCGPPILSLLRIDPSKLSTLFLVLPDGTRHSPFSPFRLFHLPFFSKCKEQRGGTPDATSIRPSLGDLIALFVLASCGFFVLLHGFFRERRAVPVGLPKIWCPPLPCKGLTKLFLGRYEWFFLSLLSRYYLAGVHCYSFQARRSRRVF